MIMGAKQSGGIHSTEASMVEGALDLVDMKIASIMVPRINVVALEV
jgi:CBS domain containing-hemolysin-like protein